MEDNSICKYIVYYSIINVLPELFNVTSNAVLLIVNFSKLATSSLVALTSMELVVLSTVSTTDFVASSIEASETFR